LGFTHYYNNKRAFTNKEWSALTNDVRKLLSSCGVPIAGPHGTEGTKPVFTNTHIMFNGVEEDAHETAYVNKEATEFAFCKTARKPYDPVVVAFFKLIRKYDPNVQLSSDGGSEVFAEDTGKYNGKLDPLAQISTEERIASYIFEKSEISEEDAAKAGREILNMVLEEFRPDLFVANEAEIYDPEMDRDCSRDQS
jgi:hypothetical protein